MGASSYHNPALHDAELNPTGHAEALAAGAIMRAEGHTFDLVVVSPLRRTLKTAVLLFDSVPVAEQPPFLALEMVREAFGMCVGACAARAGGARPSPLARARAPWRAAG